MSSHRVIYLISQWHPGNEWCLQEMNTAQPIATGKPQEKILEIMYFSAQLPSGEESRERALLTLQVMELKWHQAYLAGGSWDGPCCCSSSTVLSEAEDTKAKNEASKIRRRRLEPACVWRSVLDSLLFTHPTLPVFLTTQVTSSFASLPFPFTASEVEGGKHTWISSPITGKPGKMTAFYWVQKLPRFAWIHLYIVTRRDGACLRWVASLGTELRPVL